WEHYHAAMWHFSLDPATDHREKAGIAFVVDIRELRIAARMAMNLDNREILLGRAFKDVRNGISVPRNLERRSLTLIERNAMNLAGCQTVAAITRATTAQHNSDGFQTVAGEEKALQMS